MEFPVIKEIDRNDIRNTSLECLVTTPSLHVIDARDFEFEELSDLSFEKQKKSAKKIIEMQIKKTGKLFSFCTVAPVIVSGKLKEIKKFEKIGEQIGLLFQIADDLIDYKGTSFAAGKKTQKDKIKGKATLLNLFGYQNTVQYAINLKEEIFDALKKYDKKSQNLKNTINFILKRNK